MELHLVVQSEPLPQLPDDGSFTPEFRNFAGICLGMAPEVAWAASICFQASASDTTAP
jgi:hypothetical protein